MKYSIIDTLIKRYILLSGDSVYIDSHASDLNASYLIYLGSGHTKARWIAVQPDQGLRMLSMEEAKYLIRTAKKAHLNKLRGDFKRRSAAVGRIRARFDKPTFLLIIRNSEDHKNRVEAANTAFSWA
ncbi:MAG TPA: hypothetical protein ENJ82_04320 [Bacteroidetes bacterium]|nr:hypothetical protein [Bacteroidota bacterium]